MNKTMELKTTAHLFDFESMTENIKKAQWCLVDVDSGQKSLKMTKLELTMFINKSLKKDLSIHEIDTKKIIAYRDSAYIIKRDMDGDLRC